MYDDSPTSRLSRRRRSLPALVAVFATVIATLAISFGAKASADTTGSPDTNTRATAAPAAAPSPSPVATTGTLAGNGATLNIVAPASPAAASAVVHVHVDGVAGKFNGITKATICRTGLSISSSAELSPTNFGNCLATALPNGAGNQQAQVNLNSDSGKQFIDFDYLVGSGTETSHPGPGSAITCGAGNNCSLWLQEAVDTSIAASGSVFKHFDLNYFQAPNAPGVSALAGDQQATWNFTPPTQLNGGTLQTYNVTFSPSAGSCGTTQTVSAAAHTITCTTLTNFTQYTATVTATTLGPDGTTTATGPSASANATPHPTWTSGLSPTAGDHQVTLTWSAAPSGPSGYTVSDSPGDGICGTPQTTTQTSFVCTGLTNGTLYTFTVVANYAGGNTVSPSDFPSGVQATPNGTLVTQHLFVSRPQGALVLTQVCNTTTRNDATSTAGNGNASSDPVQNGNNPSTAPEAGGTSSTPGNGSGTGTDPQTGQPYDTLHTSSGTGDPNFSGYPYAQDPNTGAPLFIYPTDCRIDLGAAKLITGADPNAGQYFKATGQLNQVTVVDTRDTDPGWTVGGRATNFATAGGNHFSGDDLGWHPIVTHVSPGFTSPDGNYAQVVNPGQDVIKPAVGPAGNGLGTTAHTLATAPAGSGLGIATLDANFTLYIPVFAMHGNYVSTLTLTAV